MYCTFTNQMTSDSDQKKLSPQKTKRQGAREHAEIRGMGGGERGMAVTGSDEGERVHYWQLCPLWARQRRIHKERSDMKEGQSEWKRSQPTTWKHSEVDTFVFSAFLHLQIFHVFRRLCPRRIWCYFVNLLLRQEVLEENTFGLLWSHDIW